MNVIPCFKTHYSMGGRSILTAEPPSELKENSPISIFDIALKHNLKEITVIDDSISGFLQLYQSAQKAKVKLIYSLRLNCVNDLTTKNEEMLKTVSKIIVFIKNSQGYKDLIKISSFAACDGFYYEKNIDYANLKRLWTDNLLLVIPFYDSFIFKNCIDGHLCVPNISFTKPTFLIENSILPFDKLIQEKVINYAKSIDSEVIPARSIYYYKKDDYLAYLTFRCIHNRTTLEKPEIHNCSSESFSFEEWENQEKLNNIIIC